MSKKIFCIDIGGTKTAFACYNENGEELFFEQFPTNPQDGADSLVERVFQHVKNQVAGVSIGVIASPGPLDAPIGKIINVVTMGWKDVFITKLFEKKFGFEFKLLNDCDAGALGVWKFGGYRQSKTLCYLSVSTGIGGGAVINGSLFTGNGNAANFGHIKVSGNGLICGCGNKDCLELYASGSGIEKIYMEKTGNYLPCAKISQLAKDGDDLAVQIFKNAGEKISFALNSIVAVFDPDAVVFGGSVCKSKDLFMPIVTNNFTTLNIGYARDDGKQVLLGALAYAIQISNKSE